MPSNVERGMQGQHTAESYLYGKGWQVLARNYRVKTGEIDLIGRDGGYIVFVEVKYRRGLGFGRPCESVNPAKQRRIIKTALHYIAAHKLHNRDIRFDVVEVLGEPGQLQVNHITNAF
jgi:putative endonuclease